MNEILLVSVLFNLVLVIVLAYLYLKELGINFIFQRILDRKNKSRLKELNPPHVYGIYNKTTGRIVMLGDSITFGVNWCEFVGSKVIGRGISGDTTRNIINRLYQATDIKPEQLFILAGINDFGRLITERHANASKNRVIQNYRVILEKINIDSPGTKIYIQSILPVNRKVKFFFYKNINNKIQETNKELEKISKEYNAEYINLFDDFYKNGDMIPEYTRDGLHLTAYGYQKWKEIITPYFNLEDNSAKQMAYSDETPH